MILKNGYVLNRDFTFRKSDLLIEGEKIVNIAESIETRNGENQIIDLDGLYIIPGIIDIHTHGCNGSDTMNGTVESLKRMSEFHAANGTTAFLPTTITDSADNIKRAVSAVNKYKNEVKGAQILGINFEGPYISSKFKGVHNQEYIKKPDIEEFEEFLKIAGDEIKLATVAPEEDDNYSFIRSLSAKGITASLGHTGASYECAIEAFNNGARNVTHLFNGMIPLSHREPGIIAAALESDSFVELICDGFHIHPAVIRMVYKAKSKDRIILVSDSNEAAGLPDGNYRLGNQDIVVENGKAVNPDGRLAGSTATVFKCMKKAVEFGVKLEDAVRMCTYNPARLLGIENRKGLLAEGYDADLLVIDKELNLVNTIINGRCIQ